jgi:hypothetical protein
MSKKITQAQIRKLYGLPENAVDVIAHGNRVINSNPNWKKNREKRKKSRELTHDDLMKYTPKVVIKATEPDVIELL